MDLLKELLILLPYLFAVNANRFSIADSNITNLTIPNGVDQNLVDWYSDFMDRVVFGDPVTVLIADVFSEVFKDCFWCYPPYGCLQIGGPFISSYRPINLPPQSPGDMKVQMELYTRQNSEDPFVFSPDDVSQINNSHFNNNSKTKFLIHGFLESQPSPFAQLNTQALLARSDYNVFNVNWRRASNTNYPQAVANTRLVGAMLAHFINILKNATGHSLTQMHLIGDSLGAHVGGYTGELLKGQLSRISGCDPAGPFYEKTDPRVRLDPSDAQFVDVIHTNKGTIFTISFGIDQQIGDCDFYPNGGAQQPDCASMFNIDQLLSTNVTKVIKDLFTGCSHARAVDLYVESIWNSINSSCEFTSYACSDYNRFQLGSLGPCHTCGSNGTRCAEMGFNADRYAAAGHPLPAPDKFYLNTNAAPPYCKN